MRPYISNNSGGDGANLYIHDRTLAAAGTDSADHTLSGTTDWDMAGLVINPAALRGTVEGGMLHSLSRALYEEVTFDTARVTSTDWNTYPIMDIKDAPESIDITLIDHPERPPLGGGEATCRPLPAALANAIRQAVGVRLRELPMRPELVKAAIGV